MSDDDKERGLHTYCGGFSFKLPPSGMSKYSVAQLCDAATLEFGPGYQFAPEPASEGGLEMIAWPSHPGIPHLEGGPFKTARFHGFAGKFPVVTRDALADWRDPTKTEAFYRAGGRRIDGSFFYKAFYGAPVWTPAEVGKLMSALRKTGFMPSSRRLPTAKSLCKTGALGLPLEVRRAREEKRRRQAVRDQINM